MHGHMNINLNVSVCVNVQNPRVAFTNINLMCPYSSVQFYNNMSIASTSLLITCIIQFLT